MRAPPRQSRGPGVGRADALVSEILDSELLGEARPSVGLAPFRSSEFRPTSPLCASYCSALPGAVYTFISEEKSAQAAYLGTTTTSRHNSSLRPAAGRAAHTAPRARNAAGARRARRAAQRDAVRAAARLAGATGRGDFSPLCCAVGFSAAMEALCAALWVSPRCAVLHALFEHRRWPFSGCRLRVSMPSAC